MLKMAPVGNLMGGGTDKILNERFEVVVDCSASLNSIGHDNLRIICIFDSKEVVLLR